MASQLRGDRQMYFRSLLMDAPTLDDESNSVFRYRVRSTCALFVRLMPNRLRIDDAFRVLIEIVEGAGRGSKQTTVGGVRFVEVIDTPDSILAASRDEVGPQVLKWIEQGFRKVAPELKQHVSEAASAVRALNFVNEREATRRSFAPGSRTRYAVIHLRHEVDRAVISLRVVDKKLGTTVDHAVADERPDELHFDGYFEPPLWDSPTSVSVVNKVGIRQPAMQV